MTATLDAPSKTEIDLLKQASTAFRLSSMGLQIDGVPFDLGQFPWLVEPFDLYNCAPEDMPHTVVFKKGAQLGITCYAILSTVDRLQWLYPRAAMYLFPSRDDVTDFSKARFDRIITENAAFRHLISNKKAEGGIDAANIKSVGGKMLYFRGAKSRSQLKSIPVDFIVFDERDEMEDDKVAMAMQRMAQSQYGHALYLSTPTMQDFGVDLQYQQSDQRMWHIKCRACGTWTCLEAEWPHSIVRRDGGIAYRACKKNPDHKLYPVDGEWVAAYPDSGIVGYYVSQLNSASERATPDIILTEYETGFTASGERVNETEFHNQRLGLAYTPADDQLTKGQVLACCGTQPMANKHIGPCFMGVDVRKGQFHYIIGVNTSTTHVQVVKFGIADSLHEIHDLMERFAVECVVLDAKPEINTVLQFCRDHPQAWACHTNETQRAPAEWLYADKTVKVNRNISLDQSHEMIVHKRAELPRHNDFLERELATPFTRIARTVVVNPKTNVAEVRWVKLGTQGDDMRYAWNFACIARERVGEMRRAKKHYTRFLGMGRDRKTTGWAA